MAEWIEVPGELRPRAGHTDVTNPTALSVGGGVQRIRDDTDAQHHVEAGGRKA